MPTITLLFASLHALLLLALVVPIVRHRRRHRIGIGDGGDTLLQRRMRVQANFVEYVPMALLLLGLLEVSGLAPLWTWIFGATLLAGRILHAVGLGASAGVTAGRFLGTLATWGVIAAMAVVGVLRAIEGLQLPG